MDLTDLVYVYSSDSFNAKPRHEIFLLQFVFETQVCNAVDGLFGRLGGADVWCPAAIAGAHAADERILWELGLTASDQCTSFSACVLADLNRAGRAIEPMDLACSKNASTLVNHRNNRSRCNTWLACYGDGQSCAGTAKPSRSADDGRIPLSIIYRPAASSATYRLYCGLAFQRPISMAV